jgi:hypothetical protein
LFGCGVETGVGGADLTVVGCEIEVVGQWTTEAYLTVVIGVIRGAWDHVFVGWVYCWGSPDIVLDEGSDG